MHSNPSSRLPSLAAHRPFLFYVSARGFSEFAAQIFAVAVGWHIYELTGSAFNLGLAGLLEFLPTALFIFIAGHVADRFERRRVAQACEDYGVRVQKSVFECQLGQQEWALLRDRLLKEYQAGQDSLRFYFLDEKAVQRTEHHGVAKPVDLTEPLIL